MRIRQYPDEKRFCRLAKESDVIPVCVEILADTETPVSLLRKIDSGADPTFLFESVEGGERWGRYSFLGTGGGRRLQVWKDAVEFRQNGSVEKISHLGNPLSALREIMRRYRPARFPELPRFWGGLVGYLTYEAVSFFEAIPHAWPEEKPLAQFFIPDVLLIFDNVRHALTIVSPAVLAGGVSAGEAFASALSRVESLIDKIEGAHPETPPPPDRMELLLEPFIDEEHFRRMVRKVKSHIEAGDIIQAVISQPFTCNAPPDPWPLYRAQRFVNPSPYLFFLRIGGTALVGSSPETMVRLENRSATLRPIAGTRPRGATEQIDRTLADELLADEKERAEHLMLVDLGRNDLGRVAETGTVQVTDLMAVERYSHVMHLVSNICCDLQAGYDAWDLLAATFPAGTLSGAPKVRAMEIISEVETFPRGPYGGAVGYVSFEGNMDMAITIRTAWIEDGKLTVQSGAGIVADSDPERERRETLQKAAALQKALRMLGGKER
jgi:anthranilate synthase component I